MPSVPSYYDSIGLLVICDSIDAINGIPFHPGSTEKSWSPTTKTQNGELGFSVTDSDSSANLSSEPQRNEHNEVLEHAMLSHIPVTGVLSPIGSIPYVEQQRVVYAQLAGAGQLPPNPPTHIVGGVRPNVPVAHNLNGNNRKPSDPTNALISILSTNASRTGRSSGEANTPEIARDPMNMPSELKPSENLDMSSSEPSVGVTRSTTSLAGNNNASFNSGMNLPVQIPQAPSFPPAAHGMTSADAGMSGDPPTLPSNLPPTMPIASPGTNSIPSNMPNSVHVSSMPLNTPMTMSPMAMPLSNAVSPNPSLDPSRAATPQSPADNGPVYRVEVCQICGRDFKGRKAATHKQQHIRRLHPAEYTPKRGGKKTRVE